MEMSISAVSLSWITRSLWGLQFYIQCQTKPIGTNNVVLRKHALRGHFAQ